MLLHLSCGQLYSLFHSLQESNPDSPLAKSLSAVLSYFDNLCCSETCVNCFYQYTITDSDGNTVVPQPKKTSFDKPTCLGEKLYNYPF